jgi:hypothetical protein
MRKNKQKLFYIINFIIVFAIIFMIITNLKDMNIVNAKYVFISILPFMFIHIFRIIRQYIILMETNMNIKTLTTEYLISSLTNTVLPYKLGEIYKAYLYGHSLHNYKRSIISIITDKFFDAVFILIAFIIIEQKNKQVLSYFTIVLLMLVLIVLVIYITYEKTYKLLNNFLIVNKHKKNSIKCLKVLDETNEIYKNLKSMINNREILLVMLTILSWISELFFVYMICLSINDKFNLSNFVDYINNSFFGIQNEFSKYYIFATLILSIIFIIAVFILKIFKRSKHEKSNFDV